MSDKIPTAEEFQWIKKKYRDDVAKEIMIEFAQLHVEAALKAAAKAENKYQNRNIFQHWSTETIILSAYPKENIK